MDMHRARMPAGHLIPAATGWTAAGLALALAGLLFSLVLPPALVLLATGGVLAVAGFGLAATLYLAGSRMGRDGWAAWDAAASLVFLGFAAALLADTGEALTAFEDLRARWR